MFVPNKNAVHYFEAIKIMYGIYVCKFSMSNCSFSKMLFHTSIRTLKIASEARDCKDDLNFDGTQTSHYKS